MSQATDDSQPHSIRTLGKLIRNRRVTSRLVTDRCLDRIESDNHRYNAFVSVAAVEALAAATLADTELSSGIDRGPLQGVPISLKDLIDVEGTRTTAASRVTEGQVAARDAVVVERLRQAGAVLIGKTNLHEFAFGTTSDDSAFGAARNPWDPTRSPGGSSGGSAISVVTGMAFGSIGTDTGGSVRIPAAACGIVGLKPAYGELPTEGIIPLSPTLDHPGVLASNVHGAFAIYSALRGNGRRRLMGASPVDVRFGVLHRYFCDVLDRAVSDRFDESLSRLSNARARVLERQVAGADTIVQTFGNLQAPEAYSYHAASLAKAANLYTPSVRGRIERGASIPATSYVEARRTKEQLTKVVNDLFCDVDVLILPTLPIPAPPIGAEEVLIEGQPEGVRGLMLKMTQLFNITGHPAISLPCGETPDGLPIGLQLVGALDRTVGLMEIALGCETLLAGSERRWRVNPEQDRLLV
jgi:aspartyl-tRNA(Asn)/glutamyl-tRNA(Gln) amidotransferase subunit A